MSFFSAEVGTATPHTLSAEFATRQRRGVEPRDAGHGARPALIFLAALALTGCATTRYVTVPCLAKDQALPAEPPKVGKSLTGEADKDLRIVAGSAVRLRAWGEGLNGILEGCRAH